MPIDVNTKYFFSVIWVKIMKFKSNFGTIDSIFALKIQNYN